MGRRMSCPGFVGRAEELDLLREAFDAAADRRSAVVLVGGDAGIGKTRLVGEICQRARGGGAVVATGTCVPIDGGGLPYGPLAAILRDLVRQLGETSATGVLVGLASVLGVDTKGVDDRVAVYSAVPRVVDALAKTRMFESILSCFTDLAEHSVAVLVFEDLQWADSATAELLSFLTRNLADTHVLIIGTYRAEELGRDHQLRPWLTELVRHPRVTSVRLGGLDQRETAELIEGIVGRQPEWALVEAVWARSQGNPFFAEELTAARHSASLSPEFQGVVMSRVEGLSAEAQQLVRLVAVAGAGIDHQLLAAVDVLDPDSLDAALAEVIDKQILVVDASQSGYRFRHALLQEVVYTALLPGERGRLHRLLATTLAADPSLGPSTPGHRAAALASHWWAARAWAEALDASMVAADAATAVWAFPEALTHLQRALAASDHTPTSEPEVDRVRLLEKASDVAYMAGEGERAVELARAAIEASDASADPSRVARLYALLGRNAWAVGSSDAAFAAYREAAALVPADRPSAELARVIAEEARGLMLLSRYREAERRCHEGLAAAAAVGARAGAGHLRYTLACSRALLGHHDEGIALVREALAIAEEMGSADDLNRAYMGLSGILLEAGQLEAAAAVVFDSAAVGEELWGVRLNGAATNGVEAFIRLGRFDDAKALLDQTGERGVGTCTSTPAQLGALVATRRGRFDEAHRLLAVADDLSRGMSDVQVRGSFHMMVAELALLEGRPGDAYADIERALALAAATDDESTRTEMFAMAARSLADELEDARARGRRFDADKARLVALGFVQEAEQLAAAPDERGGRRTPRVVAFAAMCAAEQSRLGESDPDLWKRATLEWDTVGEPYHAAYCRWREAEAMLQGRGGRDRAAECLREAWRASVDLGARPLAERLEQLGRRARIDLADIDGTVTADGSTVAADLGLTDREVEVLTHLAAGRTDREIAELLFISKKTVSVHVSNLLRKLDVPNRVAAGEIGQVHGLS